MLCLVDRTDQPSQVHDVGPNDPLDTRVDLNQSMADETALTGGERHGATSEKVVWVHG